MKYAAIALLALALAGCATMRPEDRYPAGANFGDGGATPCGTRQTSDGYVPFCPPPNDGDEWDVRNQPAPVSVIRY
jgi:hypothetical protein